MVLLSCLFAKVLQHLIPQGDEKSFIKLRFHIFNCNEHNTPQDP